MAKASARPQLAWEQLPESSQLIYLALAEGDEQRARRLHEQDQERPRPRPPRRRAAAAAPAAPVARAAAPPRAAASPPGRDLRGFVARGRRLVPREMADAEAWKRRQARQ
jgi:hypothetical protein